MWRKVLLGVRWISMSMCIVRRRSAMSMFIRLLRRPCAGSKGGGGVSVLWCRRVQGRVVICLAKKE